MCVCVCVYMCVCVCEREDLDELVMIEKGVSGLERK